ncbi:hypothetical protein BHM03_00024953, partial [Ensete ventricosum]
MVSCLQPIMKLLCPVLSLPFPSKVANSSEEEVNNLFNRAVSECFDIKALQKLLLVGHHGSGTSTIFKQVLLVNATVIAITESMTYLRPVIVLPDTSVRPVPPGTYRHRRPRCSSAVVARGSPVSCRHPRVIFLPTRGDVLSPCAGESSRR